MQQGHLRCCSVAGATLHVLVLVSGEEIHIVSCPFIFVVIFPSGHIANSPVTFNETNIYALYADLCKITCLN